MSVARGEVDNKHLGRREPTSGVRLPSGIVDSFLYNGDGQRVQKQDSTGTTNHVWDEENILLEADASDSIQVVYSLRPLLAGNLVSERRVGVTQYYLFDALGSTRQLADSDQNVADQFDYDSFGNVITQSGSSTTPYRYLGMVGYYYDSDTSEFYVRNRVLAPRAGRWLSPEPDWIDPIDINAYSYIMNNPVRHTDRFGLQPDGRVAACNNGLSSLMKDKAFSKLNIISNLVKCNVKISGLTSCGAGGAGALGGLTYLGGGYVNICINATQLGTLSFWTDLISILNSRGDPCVAIDTGRSSPVATFQWSYSPPPPALGGSCGDCKRSEAAAYASSCAIPLRQRHRPRLCD